MCSYAHVSRVGGGCVDVSCACDRRLKAGDDPFYVLLVS
ncbi:hypothetical protein Pd630_LPD06061 [Rhodococcus opacus PD630]|nr:hypothetical protein Pd630_LPD06061 [Rhodococcus opacus PD630]